MQLLVGGDRCASDDIGVAAEILRSGVDDGGRAELQGPLHNWGGEGAVDHHRGLPGHVDDRGHVDHVEKRVRRRLDPDQARALADRRAHRIGVALVDQVGVSPNPLKTLSTSR